MVVCRLFHYLKSGLKYAESMNLRYVKDIGRLDCNRFGFCGCIKYFEQNGYKVTVKEMNNKVDLIIIEKNKLN